MCTIPWAFGSETGSQWTHNGLVLIVVACPCALIISTPVSAWKECSRVVWESSFSGLFWVVLTSVYLFILEQSQHINTIRLVHPKTTPCYIQWTGDVRCRSRCNRATGGSYQGRGASGGLGSCEDYLFWCVRPARCVMCVISFSIRLFAIVRYVICHMYSNFLPSMFFVLLRFKR